MQSQDEKLDKFMQAINAYSERQRNLILAELEDQNAIELERAEKETMADVYRLIQIQANDARSTISRDLAAKELEIRRGLLNLRSGIEREVFAEAADKLREFTLSPKYEHYLTACAGEIAKAFAGAPESTVFHLMERDLSFAPVIEKAYGFPCKIEADSSIKIGGLLGLNTKLGRAVNATLDSRLEMQRDWFRQHSGLVIN